MERHLNLIKTGYKDVEKRILPRFPFTYLMFKGVKSDSRVFEVKDISYTGMQLALKNGGHSYIDGNEIEGELHWRGKSLTTVGVIRWVSGSRLGISFKESGEVFQQEIRQFLCIENIISSMKPLHKSEMVLNRPSNLLVWLQADGPVEIFVWQHNDGELEKFQIILLNIFVEWEDGKGIKTGNVLKKRDIDTPLINEDEFLFQLDEGVEFSSIKWALDLVAKLPETFISEQVRKFLTVKMGG